MYLINLEKGGNPYYEYFRQRFIEEMGIRVMDACLPGIARVYGVFEENNTAYIITEYVEGMSLRNYVKKLGRPMTGIEVDRAMYMAVNALSAMHRRGQLHWEINPDNVMIQPDGTAKLINFADATLRLDPKTHEIGAAMGPVVLCNGFSPMEVYQVRGTRGPWTDIYGMCATLYWCMTGMKPPAAFERILEDSLDWSALKDLTPIQLDAMKKGLALRGSERFQSVDEFWLRFTSAYVTIPREPEKMQPNFPEHDTEKPADRSWLKKWFVK